VNGITSKTITQETTPEDSDVYSEVNGNMTHRVITDLRESIYVYQNRKHPSTKHQIVLIGDSNMRGYVTFLQPLLNSNYNIYSVMKTGSDTNELKKVSK